MAQIAQVCTDVVHFVFLRYVMQFIKVFWFAPDKNEYSYCCVIRVLEYCYTLFSPCFCFQFATMGQMQLDIDGLPLLIYVYGFVSVVSLFSLVCG